jgi:UDP-N-acetylbacillosamine N-acetyltransferase
VNTPSKPVSTSASNAPQAAREQGPKVPLLIWGAGGHAKVVADIARSSGFYSVAGFIDDVNADRIGQPFCGSTIYGIELLSSMRKRDIRQSVVAIGNCDARLTKGNVLKQAGFELATLIHPRATVAEDVSIGKGTIVAAGAVLNSGVAIGDSVIVNTGAIVDHDCTVGDGAHICPGVTLAGRVTIGNSAWIGIGSTVIEGVTIARCSFIGAGSLVLRSIDPCVMAYGAPARQIRGRTPQ